MPKLMVFIDGSWLYYSKYRLAENSSEEDFFIDYGQLPGVLRDAVKRSGDYDDVDLCRCHMFGSFAWNQDERDHLAANKQRDFFDMLRDRYYYDVEVFPIDYRGRRLSRSDREVEDVDFEPRERWVEVSLASSMMYHAALPDGFDVALLVAGDRDFVPLLRRVRQLGKRVVIASIRKGCCVEFSDASNKLAIRDLPVIWLDDHVEELELRLVRQRQVCQSPLHEGDPEVWTTFEARIGERFFCDDCRKRYADEQRRDEGVSEIPQSYFDHSDTGEVLNGCVKVTFPGRGFGFIAADNLCDYFFHNSDLEEGVQIEDLEEGQNVQFEVRRSASVGKAGAARNVLLRLATCNA